MTISISDALANAILQGSSLKEELDGGFIYIYAGTVPTNADAALNVATTHTLLVKIAADAVPADAGVVGLTFEALAASRAIVKETTETWVGKVHFVGFSAASAGVSPLTATFYRFCDAADTPTAAGSASTPRIQGTVGTAGADMNLTSVSLSDNGANTVGLSVYEVRFDA